MVDDITAPDGSVSRVSVANLVLYRGSLNWPRHVATAEPHDSSSDEEGEL